MSFTTESVLKNSQGVGIKLGDAHLFGDLIHSAVFKDGLIGAGEVSPCLSSFIFDHDERLGDSSYFLKDPFAFRVDVKENGHCADDIELSVPEGSYYVLNGPDVDGNTSSHVGAGGFQEVYRAPVQLDAVEVFKACVEKVGEVPAGVASDFENACIFFGVFPDDADQECASSFSNSQVVLWDVSIARVAPERMNFLDGSRPRFLRSEPFGKETKPSSQVEHGLKFNRVD